MCDVCEIHGWHEKNLDMKETDTSSNYSLLDQKNMNNVFFFFKCMNNVPQESLEIFVMVWVEICLFEILSFENSEDLQTN